MTEFREKLAAARALIKPTSLQMGREKRVALGHPGVDFALQKGLAGWRVARGVRRRSAKRGLGQRLRHRAHLARGTDEKDSLDPAGLLRPRTWRDVRQRIAGIGFRSATAGDAARGKRGGCIARCHRCARLRGVGCHDHRSDRNAEDSGSRRQPQTHAFRASQRRDGASASLQRTAASQLRRNTLAGEERVQRRQRRLGRSALRRNTRPQPARTDRTLGYGMGL